MLCYHLGTKGNTHTISNNSIILNNDIDNTPTNIAQPTDQSTIIPQQFSMIIKELKNLSNKASGDITKITQAYNTSQEKTGKLIENATSQALTKAHSITTPTTPIDSRNFGTNYTNPPKKQVGYHLGWHITITCYSNQKLIHIKFTDLTKITYFLIQTTHTNVQYPNHISLDLNQSVVELFRHQTELTHSTQCLHQQTMDTLNWIARFSSHQENLH